MPEIENTIEFYLEKFKKGFPLSEIRKELEGKDYDKETIDYIIKKIDDLVIQAELNKSYKNRTNELKIAGLAIMLIGGVILIGTYFRLFKMGNYYWIPYGPIIGGYIMIFMARKMKPKGSKLTHRVDKLKDQTGSFNQFIS